MINFVQSEQCKEIRLHYGNDKQKVQAVQELTEMILLLTRRPDQMYPKFRDDIKQEIADCHVMLEQVRQIYNLPESEIKMEIDRKLKRQLDRIDKEIQQYDP